ncbi:D-2-hydroxyacid dehydrogenase family protein [Acidisphaera sp. L21]|uniref:D-2-hydroxyacid dehydrogenase family protein n=1 Tax=Acidisphaera sp. L21 TaxID=1641851 RepID=UPI00131D485B|nr:D-2-hydroxyacid dehydrogenase family protein [Acidisphaera sp. L21]
MTAPLKIAVLDDFQNAARPMADWSRLNGKAEVTFFTDNLRDDALLQRLLPYDVLVAIRERTAFSRSLIEQLPNLRLLATTGMRNRGIDLAACRDRGIPVCGTKGGGSPTAELAFGLMLALARNIVAEDRALRAGQWETPTIGFMLKGRVLGLLGLGKLGAEMAHFAQAFGMSVIAWSQNLTDEHAASLGCRRVDKADLFRQADFVSLHVVSSPRTRGIVGAAEFAVMKPGGYLINTSRSALVDEPAMIAALTEGRIAGAGLDVFDQEPLPKDAPIRAAPNTILTPHLGYATRESYESYFPQVLGAIEAWMAGSPINLLPDD